MRGNIINAIYERMKTDSDVFFLTGDMGINLVEMIQETFPTRFLNMGIAEQNLMGVSAGLCNLGYRPFTYTISQFAIHRCFEQIRNDVRLHDYAITLLGTSTGYDNAPLGPTHHIIDDWGTLRAIPGIDIYCPSSVAYAEAVVDKVLSRGKPAFIRIPKGEFQQPESTEDTVYFEGQKKDILLVSYGSPVQTCLKVQKAHDDVSVLVCNQLRPLDGDVMVHALQEHQHIYVVENHFPSSGLYNSLCQLCAEKQIYHPLKSIAPPETYNLKVGTTAAYYERLFGIDERGIEEVIRSR